VSNNRADTRLQPGRGSRLRLGLAAALIFILGATQVSSSEWVEKEATRETMQVIFDSLRYLLQIDITEGDFDSAGNRKKVLEALRELDDQAAILAAHGFYEDTGGMFLASVLERYSLLLLRSYEHGEPGRVQDLLYGITDVCIACHTRVPSPRDSPVARQFADSRAIASLPAKKRARIQVATRRFDDALETLETLLESPKVGEPALLEDVLRTYLIVNIRVKGDMERPIPVLETIEERSAEQPAWRRDIETWLASLQHYRDKPFVSDLLQSAREIIEAADKADFPSRRSALVEYIAASSLLNRYLKSEPADTMDVSEAHYLLGVAEYRIHRDDWLPQAELYLEISIVLAPDAAWAEQAYGLLVEKIDRTYARTPGGKLPPDVEERLWELRQAIDGVRPPSAGNRVMPATGLT
jgi:tetratricopeptide (TPR) repeat protein